MGKLRDLATGHQWEKIPNDVRIAMLEEDARIEALEARIAKADALAKWVEGIIEDGCPKCGGDCSSANPPVAYCPMLEAMSDLAAYRESDT